MRVVALIGVLAFCGRLGAAVVNVSDVASLRTAILNSNASASGGDTIVLASGTYTITSPIGSGDPNVAIDILKPITLKSANGAASVTINANGLAFAIRTAASGTVIDGLTITNTEWAMQASDWTTPGHVITGIVLRNLIVSTKSPSNGHALSFNLVNDSVIELCTVTFAYNHGISIANSNRNLLINNTIAQTAANGDGIALVDSDHNTVTGNSIGSTGTNIGFDGVFLIGSQYNYVGFNTILNPHNGVTLTRNTTDNRFSIRNWVGNNHIVLRNLAGSDGLWFNDTSDYNMAFGNDATGAYENGMALFTSRGNYLQGNVFFANPHGGIFLNSLDVGPTADHNAVQQNYLYNHPANGGVTTVQTTNDDIGFNFIAGNPALFSQGIAGLLIQGSSGEKLYSNVIKDLRQPEVIGINYAASTSASLYLNRHFHAPDHYSLSRSATQWDSGSPVLGGNYYSDFGTANGNPSNGSTPYTNIFQDVAGNRGLYKDNYPYQSEALGKAYGVVAQLPAAGTSLAAGTFKTISWISQGCVYVDLTLLNSANSPTAIVSNYPDYGFYRWSVPTATPGAYTVRVTCKDSLTNATNASATTSSFNITAPDLALLSPQRDLMVDSGAAIQFAWRKSSNVTSGVDVYIRYHDSDSYTLLQSGVTNDFVTLTPPSPPASNRVNVKIVAGSFADSTDGWFSIRSTSSGQFTSPAAAGATFYVGTPYPLEWISPTGTDYVDIDLLGGSARNIATKLADFGRYLVLIPDVQGTSMTFRLTFHNSSGTSLGTATSVASAIAPGGGFSAGGGSSCTVTVSPTSPAAAGTAGTLTLTLNNGSCGWTASSNTSWLTPAAASGTSATLSVTVAANATGAQRSGTLTIGGQTVTVTQAANNPSQIPSLVSLNPFQGTGLNATLTLVYAHPNGWAAIRSAEFILNPRWEATSRTGGCYLKYAPATGLFTLIADDGNSIAGSAAPGAASAISNSQCTLNAATSSVTGSGNTLTVVAALTFQPSFTGQRHIWMQAVDYNNLSTNWLVYGVWFPTQTTVNAGPWYRIYDPFSNSYLYSADQNEYNTLGARGFVQQDVSGLVMDGSTTVGGISNMAWYRVFVNATNSHLWTSDRNEFLTLINAQSAYVGEGVAAFVMPYINSLGQVSPQVTNTIPFYRAAFSGKNLHFWTPDADEFFGTNGKHLPTGYFGEGIASYIFPASGAQFSDGAPVTAAADAVPEDDGSPAVVSVVNAASLSPSGVIGPGEALSIYGRHLGGRVLVNGVAAEVVSVRDNEIRVVVPKELASDGEVSLEVEHRGYRTKAVKLGVVRANPAIFGSNAYGRGNAQARNEDGTMNAPDHAAARGSVVTLYTTGFATDAMELPVEVHIGWWPAEVIAMQVSATRAGVIEVQVRVPETVDPAAFQPVVLHVGNLFSQPGVGLAVE